MSRQPTLFVLGDSISVHYAPYLKQMLRGTYACQGKRDDGQALKDLDIPVGANGGDSTKVLAYIREQAAMLRTHDFMLFNCGLHDLKTDPATGSKQIPLEQYTTVLTECLELLQQEKIRGVWVRITPVRDELHNRIKGFHRFNQDVEQYNWIADGLMQQYGIPEIDLYSFTASLGEDLHYDGVHFHEHIRAQQAAFIAGWLSAWRIYG